MDASLYWIMTKTFFKVEEREFSIVRKTSVAFRSAKVAFFHSFAERKATIKDRTMLSKLKPGRHKLA